MQEKTVVYHGRKLLSEIVGILIPSLPKGTGIDVYEDVYTVVSYGIVIEDGFVKAVIRVD